MQARVFGGLRVGGLTDAEIGSRKARTLLAVLLLARGAPVRTDRLADVLWGDALPERPAEQLGVLVSRLRRVLGPDAVQRTGKGYAAGLIAADLTEFPGPHRRRPGPADRGGDRGRVGLGASGAGAGRRRRAARSDPARRGAIRALVGPVGDGGRSG
ncbi:MAG: AfsR/SARP family transcriptional regulator [Pseudonocardiaceae bacterium]